MIFHPSDALLAPFPHPLESPLWKPSSTGCNLDTMLSGPAAHCTLGIPLASLHIDPLFSGVCRHLRYDLLPNFVRTHPPVAAGAFLWNSTSPTFPFVFLLYVITALLAGWRILDESFWLRILKFSLHCLLISNAVVGSLASLLYVTCFSLLGTPFIPGIPQFYHDILWGGFNFFFFPWCSLGELLMPGDCVLRFSLYVFILTLLFSLHHFFLFFILHSSSTFLILYHLFNTSYFVLLFWKIFQPIFQVICWILYFGYYFFKFQSSFLIFDCFLLLAFLLYGWNIFCYFFNII